MAALDFLAAMATAAIWMGAYAQLVGMPMAWFCLRKLPAWRERPDGLRGIDLLAEFILGPTALTILWGWAILAVAAVGGLGFSGGALLAVLFGAPAIFVPWVVLQLDIGRFPGVVDGASRRRERKLARRGGGA